MVCFCGCWNTNDTEESSIIEHREHAESMVATRNVIKIQKRATVHGVELVLLGLENQEHIHYQCL